MMDFEIVNLTSLRSSGTNGRIASREWAMSEEEGGNAGRGDEGTVVESYVELWARFGANHVPFYQVSHPSRTCTPGEQPRRLVSPSSPHDNRYKVNRFLNPLVTSSHDSVLDFECGRSSPQLRATKRPRPEPGFCRLLGLLVSFDTQQHAYHKNIPRHSLCPRQWETYQDIRNCTQRSGISSSQISR
jgi:hypothetical protein